jgi:uncharacterized membrane protein YgdD (TMEM256/DUF423 family)
MQKKYFVIGGTFALLSVVLGAMAAHALRDKLEPHSLESFNTGVKFMFYHALALLIFGVINNSSKLFARAGNLLITGTILFSGSIYVLSTQGLMGVAVPKPLGLITPLGGVFLITGWALFILSVLNSDKKQ